MAEKESVFLEDYPERQKEWENKDLQEFFSKLFPLRERFNKELEELRRKGAIGSNLQAGARLILEKDFITPVLTQQEQLEFFGLSQLGIEEGMSLNLEIKPAQGDKCLRCWFVSSKMNEKGICPKCVKNLLEK